jgi:hypothetical protein
MSQAFAAEVTNLAALLFEAVSLPRHAAAAPLPVSINDWSSDRSYVILPL